MLQIMDQILQSSSSKESLLNATNPKKSSSQLLKASPTRANSSSVMQNPYENSSSMRKATVMFSNIGESKYEEAQTPQSETLAPDTKSQNKVMDQALRQVDNLGRQSKVKSTRNDFLDMDITS